MNYFILIQKKRQYLGKFIDVLGIYKIFLKNTSSDKIIVKSCNNLENLKKNWNELWQNNVINIEIEDSFNFLIQKLLVFFFGLIIFFKFY